MPNSAPSRFGEKKKDTPDLRGFETKANTFAQKPFQKLSVSISPTVSQDRVFRLEKNSKESPLAADSSFDRDFTSVVEFNEMRSIPEHKTVSQSRDYNAEIFSDKHGIVIEDTYTEEFDEFKENLTSKMENAMNVFITDNQKYVENSLRTYRMEKENEIKKQNLSGDALQQQKKKIETDIESIQSNIEKKFEEKKKNVKNKFLAEKQSQLKKDSKDNKSTEEKVLFPKIETLQTQFDRNIQLPLSAQISDDDTPSEGHLSSHSSVTTPEAHQEAETPKAFEDPKSEKISQTDVKSSPPKLIHKQECQESKKIGETSNCTTNETTQ
ncbi:hypothetical protein RFI_24344, partial [Reticulomyxa filosa]